MTKIFSIKLNKNKTFLLKKFKSNKYSKKPLLKMNKKKLTKFSKIIKISFNMYKLNFKNKLEQRKEGPHKSMIIKEKQIDLALLVILLEEIYQVLAVN